MKFLRSLALIIVVGWAVPASAPAEEFDSVNAANRIAVLVETTDIVPLAAISKALAVEFSPAADSHVLMQNNLGREGKFYLPAQEATWIQWLWIHPNAIEQGRLSVDVSFTEQPCVSLDAVEKRLKRQAKRYPYVLDHSGRDDTDRWGPLTISYRRTPEEYVSIEFGHATADQICLSRVRFTINHVAKH